MGSRGLRKDVKSGLTNKRFRSTGEGDTGSSSRPKRDNEPCEYCGKLLMAGRKHDPSVCLNEMKRQRMHNNIEAFDSESE